MKIENQRAKLQPITKSKHRLKANIQLLFFQITLLGQGRSAGILLCW